MRLTNTRNVEIPVNFRDALREILYYAPKIGIDPCAKLPITTAIDESAAGVKELEKRIAQKALINVAKFNSVWLAERKSSNRKTIKELSRICEKLSEIAKTLSPLLNDLASGKDYPLSELRSMTSSIPFNNFYNEPATNGTIAEMRVPDHEIMKKIISDRRASNLYNHFLPLKERWIKLHQIQKHFVINNTVCDWNSDFKKLLSNPVPKLFDEMAESEFTIADETFYTTFTDYLYAMFMEIKQHLTKNVIFKNLMQRRGNLNEFNSYYDKKVSFFESYESFQAQRVPIEGEFLTEFTYKFQKMPLLEFDKLGTHQKTISFYENYLLRLAKPESACRCVCDYFEIGNKATLIAILKRKNNMYCKHAPNVVEERSDYIVRSIIEYSRKKIPANTR